MKEIIPILVILLFLIIVIIKISFQSILFHPKKTIISHPSYPFDNLYIYRKNGIIDSQLISNNRDKGLNIWYFHSFSNTKTVLYFHGNYGNLTYSSHIIDVCHYLHFNLLMVEYQGFGLSSGYPSIGNIIKDSVLGYQFLLERCNPENIIIWGESLGGFPASYIASHYSCRAVVLLATFSTLNDINKYGKNSELMSWCSWIVKDEVEKININRLVQKIKYPIIIVHSQEDQLIPYQCGIINFESIAHQCKKFITIKGQHAEPQITKKKLKVIFDFCDLNPYFDNIEKSVRCVRENIKRVKNR